MTDITLLPITSGYNLTKINANFDIVQGAINDEVLHTAGGSNTMLQELDMNSQRVINLPYPISANEPVRLQDLIAVDSGDSLQLRLDLNTTSNVELGAAMIGRGLQVVGSILELQALKKTSPSKFAFTTRYYSDIPGGSGFYYLDVADTTSVHNGGSVIVATDGGRWKMLNSGEYNVKQFGAKGDGVTDDTAACQAAITAAIPTGLRVYIPAGVYSISGTGLVVNNTGAGSTVGTQTIGYRTSIRGDGQGTSILLWNGGAAQSCLKVITGGSSRALYENFSILQPGVSKVGYGLVLSQTAHAEFKNISIEGFEYGVKADDNFSIVWNSCRFAKNTIGFDASFIFVSRPNDFGFNNCNFLDNVTYGANFQNPTTLVIKGGSFEGNGSNIVNNGALRINGNPIDGIAGLTAEGVYFENNAGSFDVAVLDSTTGGIHNIIGCTFNRISNARFTTTNIALYKNTATWRTMIRVHGNGFAGFGTYVPDPSRKYIQVVAPVDNFYVMDVGLNIWGVTTEIPTLPGAMGTDRQVAAAVRFNGSTGVIDGVSVNVASIVKNGAGDYTINYTKPLKDIKNVYSIGVAEATCWSELFSESASSLRFKTKNASSVYADFASISVLVYGQDGGI